MGQTRGTGRRRPQGLDRLRVETAQTQVAGWIRSRAGRRGRSPAPIQALSPSLTLKPWLRVARIKLRPLRWTGRGTRVAQRRLRRTRSTERPRSIARPGRPRRSSRTQRRPWRRAAKPLRVAQRRHRQTWDDPGMAGRVKATAGLRWSGHPGGSKRTPSLRSYRRSFAGRRLGQPRTGRRTAVPWENGPRPHPIWPRSSSLLQLHPSAIQDGSVLCLPHPGTGSAPNRSPLARVGNARSLRAPSRVRRPPWPAQPTTLRPPPGFRKPSASNLRPPPIPRPRLRGPRPPPSGLKPRHDGPRLLPNIPRPRRDDHRLPPCGLRSGRRLSSSDPPHRWARRSRAPRPQPRARRALSTVRRARRRRRSSLRRRPRRHRRPSMPAG